MIEVLPNLVSDVSRYVDSVRRQAPAAKMIGKFAVAIAVKKIQEQIVPVKKVDAIQTVESNIEVMDSELAREVHNLPQSFLDYEMLSARQILQRLDELSSDDVSALLRYEKFNRNRSTLISGLNNHLGVSTEFYE